jgi:hypothetical protein
MAWYYEIVSRSQVLEKSEAVYATHWEAEWAGYQCARDRLSLLSPLPETGWVAEGSLRSVLIADTIRAKHKDD